MPEYAALDVSQKKTAICVVDESGRIVDEVTVPTGPDAIGDQLKRRGEIVRIGRETGPLAVWLWNELHDQGLPVICLDARHANAALKVRANKTDRNDAAGLAQIVRTGWFKEVKIKSAPDTSCALYWPVERYWSGHGSRSRTRSAACCVPSGSSSEPVLGASPGELVRF